VIAVTAIVVVPAVVIELQQIKQTLSFLL